MTTGLQLGTEERHTTEYVGRLTAAGVTCLAFGTGVRLTHADVPPALIDAATQFRLPLLQVPEGTPFLAITKFVYEQLADARYATQIRALEAQRTLTAAAVHPGGVEAVVSTLATLTGIDVLVTDPQGRVLAASPRRAAALRSELLTHIEKLRHRGLQGSASMHQPGQELRVQALGSRRLRGFLLCAAPTAPGQYERQLVAAAVSLLTLDLERVHRVGDADRRRRSEAAKTLLQDPLTPAAATELLAAVGVRATALRAVVLVAGTGNPDVWLEEVAATLGEAVPTLLTVSDRDVVVLLAADPPDDLHELVREALRSLGAAAPTAGVGGRVSPEEAVVSVRQARRAAETASGPGDVTDVLSLPSTRLLLEIPDPDAVASFADTVLGPLEKSGARGHALLTSLRTFLECNGAEEAAARLGVHRHTLRQRLRSIEKLTGRRLDSGHDRMELLLALEARDIVGRG
jgi:purine catabolism regulator